MSPRLVWNVPGVVERPEVLVQIIEYLEVYGSQVRYPNWRDQFVGKTVKSPLRLDEDIANIAGATLSSRHVTDGIKRLLFLHQAVLR